MQSIARNAAALAIGGLIAQFAFVAIEVLIARQLGSQGYGVFSFVFMLALTSVLTVDMGLTWYTVERGSRNPTSIASLMGTTTVMKLWAFVLVYPIVIGLMVATNIDPNATSFFTIFFFYAVIIAIQDSLSAVNSARQTMQVNAVFQGFAPLAVGAVVLLALPAGITLSTVAAAYVGGAGLVTAYWWYYTQRKEKPIVALSAAPAILRDSYLYGLTGILAQLFYKCDILLISFFSSMPQVGIYAAGYKLLDVAYKIPILAVRVFSPQLYKMWDADRPGYARLADVFMRISLTGGCALAIFCYFGATPLIAAIFGDKFSGAAPILQLLSASFALKFITNCLQTMLSTMGRHSQRTAGLACATLVLIVLHVSLIPSFGASGAAISVVMAEAALVVIYLWAVADHAVRNLLVRRLVHSVFVVGVALAIPVGSGLSGFTAAIVGCLAFIIGSLATRLLAVADFELLTKSGSPAAAITE